MGTEATEQVSWGHYSGDEEDAYSAEPLPELCYKADVQAFSRAFQPSVSLTVAALGLAGNGLVLATHLAARRAARSPTSAHLLQLALADLLLALTLPFAAAGALQGWSLGSATCRTISGLYSASFHAGFLFLACISADRYVAIARALPAGPRPSTPGRAHLVSVIVWLLSLLLALPALLFSQDGQREGQRRCRLIFPEGLTQTVKGASAVAQVALGFALPLGVMVACYALLGRTLLAARGPERRRALRVVVALVAAFVVLQLPYSLALLLDTADLLAARERSCPASKRKDVALLVTSGLALARCGLNPVLYAFLGLRFRQDLRRLLRGGSCPSGPQPRRGCPRRPRLSSCSAPTETHSLSWDN
ncbi:CCR10 isoform 3 [Pan troglodytes]|uniref:C-C chemokine receptor type 10 n=6 Tax=Homininae TaxID=207598 RepID=CCR10_HUMAN|nr:C-C chemokine receptor type 10 [Homo sapiens]XP_016786489.2 C-C chemokine receptor type 10 [Pan troglodytes]P46092.3 RecName: Full=C-C chemokine receptor type 10; Short=C-C CKR-10; Short=CC-CKR-10; Short=CCR-10; AltName: Full=G-protein coupled receptor 2 [Homo sapiens]ACE87769.1 chemokine (C-C motif) receptor 10 protein [synthetic construct]AAH98132.1 Chemokine (C-C motif) receptor 10 [Homo sapiens]AAH98157.1 Chemokine (C-C motif) receptor 10 [Homo sapiens]AAH98304.1 Chemokine (C-C motif) |eukprot:NP_057686.2 C-C chemokine receptor type 10 [Homo sapiens]